ncbi:MAG: riboflavin biosynthesis protein RibF [Candidatus Omnitrophota bacterium]|jgi:riboflavin kinase/FMN adenylyltransferase
MKVIRGIKNIKGIKKSVVAIGVFDGVHCGHINIIRNVVKQARKISGKSVVVTFLPHPQKEPSLYSLDHRLRLIAGQGINICVVVDFDRKFASIPAKNFIKDVLFKKLGAKYIFVGSNFRFGKYAKGNIDTLNKFGPVYGFKVKVFKVIRKEGLAVSSTLIRTLIKKGELDKAENLLTRPVSVLGTVIKGASLARQMGVPTANINPHHEVTPGAGIYAVRVFLNDKKYSGACYIGRKPTFNITKDRHIEVYIFNFNRDIYGKDLEIQFLKKIRNGKKFSSLPALACQIKKDIRKVTQYLSTRTP